MSVHFIGKFHQESIFLAIFWFHTNPISSNSKDNPTPVYYPIILQAKLAHAVYCVMHEIITLNKHELHQCTFDTMNTKQTVSMNDVIYNEEVFSSLQNCLVNLPRRDPVWVVTQVYSR